jgi:hypothetical protein
MRNPEPHDLLWWGGRPKGGRGANKRVDPSPRLIVEVGRPARRRDGVQAPPARDD